MTTFKLLLHSVNKRKDGSYKRGYERCKEVDA